MYSAVGSKDKRAIRYELKNFPNGWRLSVDLPSRVPNGDHQAVLQWLEDYQKEVRLKNPNWLTAIKAQDNGYTLHILRADNSRELLNAVNLMADGDKIRSYWSGALEYAG